MATETLPIAPSRESSLTWRASLNLVQSLLDYGVKLAVRLIVIPILVTGLGRSLFGVWEMLGRLAGYIESTDGRPTQALRLVISNLQFQGDAAANRRWVGSALVVWLGFLPLWIGAGALLIWSAPTITKAPPELHTTVRIACSILMAGILIGGLASLPESVLRGMNLGYKRMGLQAGLAVLGGLLIAGAIYGGFGLVGVAVAGAILTAVTGVAFWILVRRQVPWFGAERPRGNEVATLFQMSLWVAAGDVVAKLLLASDVIVIGAVLSPASVTTYVLTGYAALLAANLYALAADAAMPGLGGLIGEKSHARANAARRELMALTFLFAAATGATILLWNRSFVQLWVGPENYAGLWVNLLLVLIAVQTVFIRCDAYIIDAALQPARRVRVSAIAAAIVLTLSLLLAWQGGLIGLCVGILLGRSTQTIWYPILVQSILGRSTSASYGWLVRALAIMALIFAGAAVLAERVVVGQWIAWGAATAITFGLAFMVALWAGLPPDLRSAVVLRLSESLSRIKSQDRRGSRP
jgi:O-antigen/teichoic acid export membrane protein